MTVERFLRRGDKRWVIGEAEIIVSAGIDHSPAIGDWDLGILRTGDDSFRLVKTLSLNFLEGVGEFGSNLCEHGAIFGQTSSVVTREQKKMKMRLAEIVNNR